MLLIVSTEVFSPCTLELCPWLGGGTAYEGLDGVTLYFAFTPNLTPAPIVSPMVLSLVSARSIHPPGVGAAALGRDTGCVIYPRDRREDANSTCRMIEDRGVAFS